MNFIPHDLYIPATHCGYWQHERMEMQLQKSLCYIGLLSLKGRPSNQARFQMYRGSKMLLNCLPSRGAISLI